MSVSQEECEDQAIARLLKRVASPSGSTETPEDFVARLRARREDVTSGGSGSGESACAEPPIARQRTREAVRHNDDSDEDLAPEERGRRMFQRGNTPPSPHLSNEAVGRGYNAALAFDFDVDHELEIEREIEAEQTAAVGQHVHQQLALPAAPFAFLQPATSGSLQHVVAPNVEFMPPFRGTKALYTPPDATEAVMINIEPKPSTLHSYGNIVLASPWMGGGKTTAKREYQKALIRESPMMRTLDLDCNRIYSMSNSVNLKATAKELRAEPGLSDVQSASYLDDKQQVDLSKYQMVGCSFESLFKLDDQRFGLVTGDELSALALKIGGGTMPHFQCVAVLRELLAKPDTRFLGLDAAAGFKMCDTEPCTVVEHFLQLVAPNRKVLSVALDPGNRSQHLHRRLRPYYGMNKEQTKLFWGQLANAIAAWQTDKSRLILFGVGTKSIGRKDVHERLKGAGVPFKFYHGDSNQKDRFRDLGDPGTWWAGLGAVVATTVVGRGVDLPGPNDKPPLNVSKVFVAMDRMGCDFGDLFQFMLRARKVLNSTIEVLLVDTMEPELHARLVAAGKRKPIKRPTYGLMLKGETARRGWAMRMAERQARASGAASGSAPGSDALLRLMAHARLNRQMQLVDPVYVLQRYAAYYDMPIENVAPTPAQPVAAGALQLDEDDAFDLNTPSWEKWKIVAKKIREHGEHEFFNDECWGLDADDKRKSNDLTTLEIWLVKAYHGLKHIGELPEHGDDEKDDPADKLLCSLLGDGSDHQDKTPALALQARCLVRTPEEQMRQDDASKIEAGMKGKPSSHEHCEYSLGQKMTQVELLGKLLLRGGYRHVRQVFDLDGSGIVNNANAALVAAANRQILKQSTDEDTQLLQQLQQIAEQLKVSGKKSTIIEVLRGLGTEMGLSLECKYEQVTQPNGTRPRLVRADPGLCFERVLPEVVAKWLIWSPAHSSKVSVADWQSAHAELQLQQADDVEAADDHDYGDLFSAPFNPPNDGIIGGGNTRIELIPDHALQNALRRLQAQHNDGVWMDSVPQQTRVAWNKPQRARYKQHLQTTNALNVAKAIDREAEPADEAGLRVLRVVYGKNSLDLGRRTASAPSMQNCPSALRRELCQALYHDIDIVSCHPTLMLQVVRKMVDVGALQWRDELDKLVEYAELNDNGEPEGRMPLLLRVAEHFGIHRSVAKDVCKMLVLRVLNGGSVAAWCREMEINEPAGEPQADLRDLAEVARIVREAFFAMLDRDSPGALQTLRDRVWATLNDKHQLQVRDAQRKGEPLPQPPSVAKRDRTMFSHCIFNLEDSVLDCIDRTLRSLGWIVASLIYDGVSCLART